MEGEVCAEEDDDAGNLSAVQDLDRTSIAAREEFMVGVPVGLCDGLRDTQIERGRGDGMVVLSDSHYWRMCGRIVFDIEIMQGDGREHSFCISEYLLCKK